jgi:tetrahydromethanopterin S-methyltransferase subunit C
MAAIEDIGLLPLIGVVPNLHPFNSTMGASPAQQRQVDAPK